MRVAVSRAPGAERVIFGLRGFSYMLRQMLKAVEKRRAHGTPPVG
jgi:hypothetical protein